MVVVVFVLLCVLRETSVFQTGFLFRKACSSTAPQTCNCATNTIMEGFEYTTAERNDLALLLRESIKLHYRWVKYAEKLAVRLGWDINYFRAVENETRQLIISILGEEKPDLNAKAIKAEATKIFKRIEKYLTRAIDAHESLETAKKDAEAWDVPLEAARAMREDQQQRDRAFKRSAAIAAAEVEEIKKELRSEEAESTMPPEPKKPSTDGGGGEGGGSSGGDDDALDFDAFKRSIGANV